MPSHGGFTLWLIFSGGLSLSSSYSSAGLIVDSQVNVFYNADSLSLSLIDPSSTGKGEGWTSPNYRNTGGRGPPPGGGPRRFISPSDILACLLESCLKTVKSTIQHDVKIQTHGWVWRGPRWCGLATSSCDGWRMRLKTHSPCFHWTVVSQGTGTCLHAHCTFIK